MTGKYIDDKHRAFASAVRELRMALGITLRDASNYIGVTSTRFGEFENGTYEPFVPVLGDMEVVVMCHRCHESFTRKPILNIAFPAYLCQGCVDDGEGYHD